MDVSLQYLQNEQQLSHWFLTGKPQNTAHESLGPHSSNNHLKLMPLTNSNMHFISIYNSFVNYQTQKY